MRGKKTPKIEALVVNAIRRLQDAQGLSPREISNYITQEYDVPGTEIKKQVQLALKRGVSYGILQRSKGGYYTCAQDFLRKQPMDRYNINELKCPSRRRRSRGCPKRRSSRRGRSSRCRRARSRRHRRSSRRRGSCKRRSRRSRRRGRSMCKRRRSRSRSRRRRKRSSGRRCKTSDNEEMESMSKQSKTGMDESNSRNETSSDRSSLTDPDGSMRDPRSIDPPIVDMY